MSLSATCSRPTDLPIVWSGKLVCCSGMSPDGDKFSVYQVAPSLLACPHFDDLSNSLEDSLVVPKGYVLSVGEFQFVSSLLTCPNLVDLMVHNI